MLNDNDTVNTEHPRFTATSKLRQTFQDVCAGTDAMREGADESQNGRGYLPKFPQETQGSYDLRVKTATLLNITQKTRETLCGLVFQKDITLGDDVPAQVKELAENIDNKGNHLNVFARDLFESSFDGWAAILVDSPSIQARDEGERRSLGLRPYWVAYTASNVINWDYQINPVSKRRELSLIVLREYVTERKGSFARVQKTQYRVFRLDNGVKWELWTEVNIDAAGKAEFAKTQAGVIANQTQIPVAIVGELGDKPPLMDLAFKNIEHYQTYSDYKNILHKTCVPLFYTVGLEGEPTAISSDVWFKLGKDGSMGWAEVDGSSIDKVETCLENLKREMGQLGLAMLAGKPVKGDVTATETMLDSIQETSSLQVRATQLKDALELALGFTARYLGAGEDKGGSITLGATWAQLVLSAQEISAKASLVDDGLLSRKSFVTMLHRAGQLPEDVSVDDELNQIDEEEAEAVQTRPVIDAQKFQKDPPPVIG